MLPFFHIYGMSVLMNAGLSAALDHRDHAAVRPGGVPHHRQTQKITHVYIAPPIAVALAKHPVVAQHDTSSLQMVFSGAAPLDAELGARSRSGSAAPCGRATA